MQEILIGLDILSNAGFSPRESNDLCVRWRAPKDGWIKVNSMGLTVLGQVMLWHLNYMDYGIYFGLQLALDREFKEVCFESDTVEAWVWLNIDVRGTTLVVRL